MPRYRASIVWDFDTEQYPEEFGYEDMSSEDWANEFKRIMADDLSSFAISSYEDLLSAIDVEKVG